MNLEDVIEDIDDEVRCPQCDSSDTESKEYYYRCNDSGCDVLTFFTF